MLGTKEFAYPKPLTLTQALVQQTTRPNDIVLDFFAGSGTTGHAVLAQNCEDEGNRRFILVSNTEATIQEPEKNICRDVTRVRVKKAIEGYAHTTKKGLKEVQGLGGDFAYLSCRKIPPGRLTEISHEEIWTALQLIHCSTLQPFNNDSFLWAGDDNLAIVYVPRFNRGDVSALRKSLIPCRSAILYSWQPEVVAQSLIGLEQVQYEAIPESLARRFGQKE